MAPQGTQRLIGHRLVDKDGAAVGKIGQVFYDDQTDAAKWITVRTGLFGSRENLVPLSGAEMVYDALQVPWSRSRIKSAPSFDVDQHISVEQEDQVYAHYGLSPEIPGQRVPEQYERPRGRHARPEPAERARTPADRPGPPTGRPGPPPERPGPPAERPGPDAVPVRGVPSGVRQPDEEQRPMWEPSGRSAPTPRLGDEWGWDADPRSLPGDEWGRDTAPRSRPQQGTGA
ncbi:PRC-barrel domain-containing protein [Streptomonospora arabica]|uniref:PRC-barrel domain-containing protein n=1 Tax=Streptomonospora arabica TaxID=412417 RepID=A0ABV9SJE1_9ACTN